MNPKLSCFGANAVLLDWEPKIDPELNKLILQVEKKIKKQFPSVILETIITYHSLAIYLKIGVNAAQFLKELAPFLTDLDLDEQEVTKIWNIPVCYDSEWAWDLEEMCENLNLSPQQLIGLHTAPLYRIYFIGFLPGFMYLGGLDERLHMKRKSSPRPKIEKGAVAIGGNQTGIYPSESPGGWQIIGKTPFELFDSTCNPPIPFRSGDFVRFNTITKTDFLNLSKGRSKDLFIQSNIHPS